MKKKTLVTISAIMEGVDPPGPKDTVFLLVKRNSSSGDVMSREQYPAKSVESSDIQAIRDDVGLDG